MGHRQVLLKEKKKKRPRTLYVPGKGILMKMTKVEKETSENLNYELHTTVTCLVPLLEKWFSSVVMQKDRIAQFNPSHSVLL